MRSRCSAHRFVYGFGCVKIRSTSIAYNLEAHHQAFSHSLPVGYRFCVCHGYKGTHGVHKPCTPQVSLIGKFCSRGVQISCTPLILGSGQPTPPHLIPMASMYFIRHGYSHNLGVHFFCMSPLRSRGVQKFLYVTEDNSSYSHFPSSASLHVHQRCTCKSFVS
jgi:hypothetical protein